MAILATERNENIVNKQRLVELSPACSRRALRASGRRRPHATVMRRRRRVSGHAARRRGLGGRRALLVGQLDLAKRAIRSRSSGSCTASARPRPGRHPSQGAHGSFGQIACSPVTSSGKTSTVSGRAVPLLRRFRIGILADRPVSMRPSRPASSKASGRRRWDWSCPSSASPWGSPSGGFRGTRPAGSRGRRIQRARQGRAAT